MHAIDSISSEHRLIERVVAVIEQATARLELRERVAPSLFSEAIQFLQTFMPAWHEAKEEQVFFPAMVDHGMSGYGGPICAMLFEHQRGHDLADALARAVAAWVAGDETAKRKVSSNAREYASFLRAHIAKEERILFPTALRIIPAQDDAALMTALAHVEDEQGGEAAKRDHAAAVQHLEGELLAEQH